MSTDQGRGAATRRAFLILDAGTGVDVTETRPRTTTGSGVEVPLTGMSGKAILVPLTASPNKRPLGSRLRFASYPYGALFGPLRAPLYPTAGLFIWGRLKFHQMPVVDAPFTPARSNGGGRKVS
jgi:hypothetical protein